MAAVALTAGLSACHEPSWQAELVSANAAGTDSANGQSFGPMLSADGTKVVFESAASDLGPTDTNGVDDVYVRDLTAGTTDLVSVDATGTDGGDDRSFFPQLSPDGTKVGFNSTATNLAVPATDGRNDDVYVRDLATGTTTLVSVNADGTAGGDGQSNLTGFSPDGERVLFVSWARNLVPGGSSAGAIYERDLATGTTTKLADGVSAAYSPSGDAVAFFTVRNVFLRDAATGTVTELSAGPSGSQLTGRPYFSHDGTRVAFARWTNPDFVRTDIYVYDLATGSTTLVTADLNGRGGSDNTPSRIHGFHPSDADRLLFSSTASNLVAGDTNGRQDLFVRDLRRGVTTRVVERVGLSTGNETPGYARWLGDGTRIAFVSFVGTYGVRDTNGTADVYVLDVAAGTYALVSTEATGHDGANGRSGGYDLEPASSYIIYELSASADGSRVAFGSDASDLGPTDSDRSRDHDVYVASAPE
ncbi:MAG TPA: hypothetical protein VFZ77_18520 [Acidimicrobiales bacterium]